MADRLPGPAALEPRRATAHARWITYGWAAALVVLATAAAWAWRSVVALPDVVMVYLAVIMIAALRFGRGPSIFAAALSIASYDFFFVPPIFTFAVADSRHVLTFVMMFVVGLLISGLTARLRDREQLARTEQMRSSLLSSVSHDLRTPLASITGAATTLRDRRIDEAQRAELVESICEEAARLERLVGNLLQMTRLESGAITVNREWVPMEEIVGGALTRLETALAGRQISTDVSGVPLIAVDPVLLEQVFVNLVENCLRYTPAGSPIEITARRDGAEVIVAVADRGPGIPAGDERRLFEKFYRGRHPGPVGAGLGLAIVRGITEAHGGRVTASNREGGGAIFGVTLPVGGTPPTLEGAE